MPLAANDVSPIFVWSLILAAVIVMGFVLVSWVRRRLTSTEGPPAPGFSLDDLRALHRSGQMSDQEYERARAKMAAGLRQDADKSSPRK